jgi:hypothetical protein
MVQGMIVIFLITKYMAFFTSSGSNEVIWVKSMNESTMGSLVIKLIIPLIMAAKIAKKTRCHASSCHLIFFIS